MSIQYHITLKAFAQDELDLKMHGSESLPIYFGRKNNFQWWALLWMKQQFTERTLKTEDKHLCAKPLCLRHPFWKAVVIYTWGKICIVCKKIVWKYPVPICQGLQNWCTESAPTRIFCRSSTLENIWGGHTGMIGKYISFTLFFPDDPVAEPQHVQSENFGTVWMVTDGWILLPVTVDGCSAFGAVSERGRASRCNKRRTGNKSLKVQKKLSGLCALWQPISGLFEQADLRLFYCHSWELVMVVKQLLSLSTTLLTSVPRQWV